MAALLDPTPGPEARTHALRRGRAVLATDCSVFPLRLSRPATPTRPITLLDAINLGRQQGVNAAIARLNLRAANARTGERRADLLPTSAAGQR